MWDGGQNYKGSEYHGAYPPGYMKRVKSLFPDLWIGSVHLFSGSLAHDPDIVRIDLNSGTNPDIVIDAEAMPSHLPGNRSLIVADPPYTEEDANHYGTIMINRKKVIAECHRVLRSGGFLVWLDQVRPMYRKTDWNLVGAIGFIRSTNHRMRLITILEKR